MDTNTREKLIQEIANLDEQKQIFERDLANTDAKTAKHDAIQREIEKLNEKLAAKEEELKELDGAGQAAQEEISSHFDRIQVGELVYTLRDLTDGEYQYQLLSAWLQQKFAELAQREAAKNVALRHSFESEIESLKDELAETSKYREMYLRELDKVAELEVARDNAASRTFEAEEETKRLETELKNLRDQIEKSSQPTTTNLNTNLAEIARKIEESKPKIYNKRWENDIRRVTYLAELATTGETVKIPHLEIGKYKEVTEEEALSFRTQAEQVETPIVEDSTLVEPIYNFPNYEESAEPGLAETAPTVAGPADETFEQEVRRRLGALEAEVKALIGEEEKAA